MIGLNEHPVSYSNYYDSSTELQMNTRYSIPVILIQVAKL